MGYEVYTDGSCSLNNVNDLDQDGYGGYGFVIVEDNVAIHDAYGCFSSTTNNRMELRAVLDSMLYMEEKFPDESYTLYTDSAYIANCFAQGWYKKWQVNGYRTAKREPVKNTDLWKEIIHIYRRNKEKITVQKVPGHRDVNFNVRADELANTWRTLDREHFSIDERSSNSSSGCSK